MEKTDPLGTQVQTLEGFRIVLDLKILWICLSQQKLPNIFNVPTLVSVDFRIQFYRKIVDLSSIRTRIVGVEGNQAYHQNCPYKFPIL